MYCLVLIILLKILGGNKSYAIEIVYIFFDKKYFGLDVSFSNMASADKSTDGGTCQFVKTQLWGFELSTVAT